MSIRELEEPIKRSSTSFSQNRSKDIPVQIKVTKKKSKYVQIEESMDTSSTKSSIFKTISERGAKR
jgi:hypothetical protein